MPVDQPLPPWAVRLREERTSRLWSQKIAAVRLRAAADVETRAVLPAVSSIQRYIRDYEAGKHFPADLYAELYCRAFGLTRDVLFGDSSSTPAESADLEDLPTESQARSLTTWIAVTNISDERGNRADCPGGISSRGNPYSEAADITAGRRRQNSPADPRRSAFG